MYAGRLNLKSIVLGTTSGNELPIGGVITLTDTVENYPGFIHLTGVQLAQKIEEHAKQYNVDIKEEKIEEITEDDKFRFFKELDELSKKYVGDIDDLGKKKE